MNHPQYFSRQLAPFVHLNTAGRPVFSFAQPVQVV